ncbi:MAG: TolB family protein, partial [Candidatus Eiseniibacteriota bacterium]
HATWFPGGQHLCLGGNEPGKGNRLYRYDIARHEAKAFTEGGYGRTISKVSPDGRHVITRAPTSGGYALYPVDGGAPRVLETLLPNERPIGWTPDGSAVWVLQLGVIPAPVHRVDLKTEKRELWMEITPRTKSGIQGINSVCLSADGQSYATSYVQMLCELYGVRGLA